MNATQTMNEFQPQKTLSDYLGALRRYRGRMLGVIVVLLVASLGVAFGLPPVYRSSATILIEQQEIPQDLVRSTITSFADQRIQVISQRVMTRANLTEIVKKYDLYAADRKTEPMEVIIEQMRDDIRMSTVSADVVDPRSGRPTLATIAFSLSYDSESPVLAQRVANELVSLYMSENLKNRTESANETSGFLTAEVDKLAGQISAYEQTLAQFKSNHVDELPELVQLNLQLLDRTDRELMEVDRDMRALRERGAYLETQLALVSKSTAVYTQSGERIMGPSDRLKFLQTKYLGMVSTYGADHPDLIRTRREIDALQAETGNVDIRDDLHERIARATQQLDEARQKYSAEHPDVKRLEREVRGLRAELDKTPTTTSNEPSPDNPAFVQLKAQRENVDAELRALEIKRTELKARLGDYESRVTQSPQVEREFRELTRDYENAWAKYKELKAKQMEAQLAQVMELERKGERFTLIEPPELPEKPLKPNRTAILLLGVVFSFAGGIGTVAVSESSDGTVRGARGVLALTEMPPLASIPVIETAQDRRRRNWRRAAIAAGLVIAASSAAAALHFFVMPLDIFWYAALRKLNLF